MSMMNSNSRGPASSHQVPNAPKAPPLPAKAGKPAKPIVVAGKAKLPPVGPKAPAPKPGSSQSNFSEVTRNAKKPGK